MASIDDLIIAINWLDQYDNDDTENAKSCKRVKDLLMRKIDEQEFKAACKSAGVSVFEARKAIKKYGA